MPLQLIPTLEDMKLPQIEAFVRNVRFKRLAAVVAYQQIKDEKIAAEKGRVGKSLARQVELLGKELMRLDNLCAKVEDRVNTVRGLKDQIAFIEDMGEIKDKQDAK